MARRTKEQLNKICKQHNVDKLWSFSRYDCYKTDKWEYFLKYILKEKEDKKNGIYCVAGNVAHEILEKLYLNEIDYDDMSEKYEDELFAMDCAELKYNQADEEKNKLIKNKYESCMRHFFKNHHVIKAPHKVEEFILIKISDKIYFQGYADFIYIENKDGKKIIHIVDYKTSTKYSGSAIESHGKQLMLYAEGIRQSLNIPIENIICEWNFLKYVTATVEQKNGKSKDRYIERNSIGESLVNTAKMWLKSFGYNEEQIEQYTATMINKNSLDDLPTEVKEKFKFADCYIQVPIDEEKIENLKKDIISTINEINEKENKYLQDKDEDVFWQEVTTGDEYRLYNLSGYSRRLHKPWDEYLKNKEMFVEDSSEEDTELMELLNSL